MEYELIFTVISALVLVSVFGVGVVFISLNIEETKIEETKFNKDLNTISAAHLIENCLKNGGEHITKSFLDANKGEHICKICKDQIANICRIDVKARIINLETNKEWSFKYKDIGKSVHSIFVNILDEESNEIHTGRLYVEV
jgi:Na+-transporting NADH:ubiquinone oxidoreductase subunit NqrC